MIPTADSIITAGSPIPTAAAASITAGATGSGDENAVDGADKNCFLKEETRMVTANRMTDMIPEVLMDYLRDIIAADGKVRFIRLIPVKLGYGAVQEIILESESGAESRKAFGFTPVNSRFQVIRNYDTPPLLIAA
jgi:hypothetical protein